MCASLALHRNIAVVPERKAHNVLICRRCQELCPSRIRPVRSIRPRSALDNLPPPLRPLAAIYVNGIGGMSGPSLQPSTVPVFLVLAVAPSPSIDQPKAGMFGVLDADHTDVNQRRLPRGSMAAVLGSPASPQVHIPHHADRSPCAEARVHLAQVVRVKLPGVELDDSWLIYPTVKLGYSTSSGPARQQIAIVQPSLPEPGYFRTTKSVVDFLQQLQQQQQPLPGVKGQPAATAATEQAVTGVLKRLGKAFKWSYLINEASPSANAVQHVPNSSSTPQQQQRQQQEPSSADSSPPGAAATPCKRSPTPAAPKNLQQQHQQQFDATHEPSGASAVVAAPPGPAAAVAATASAQAVDKKRKLDNKPLAPGDELLLLNSAEDSSDSGAPAAISSPRAAAATAVEPCSQPTRPVAPKRRKSSPAERLLLIAAAAAAAKTLGRLQQQPERTEPKPGQQQKSLISKQQATTLRKVSPQQRQQQQQQQADLPNKITPSQQPAIANLPQQKPLTPNGDQQRGHAAGNSSSSWSIPRLPHGRAADPAALLLLAGHVSAAFPGWQLDEFWVMSPGNSSPARPRIDPCIMHPSLTHGYIRSNKATVHYLRALREGLQKIGTDIAVPGLVPDNSNKQQQQGGRTAAEEAAAAAAAASRGGATAAAIAAAVKTAAAMIGRGFVRVRGLTNDSSGSRVAASSGKRPRDGDDQPAAAADVAESSAAAGAATAAAAAAKRKKVDGIRLGDGRVPCPETLETIQKKINSLLPGTVLDDQWIAYPGGEFFGCKLDVCVMHPSLPLGYFRSMKAVMTYVTTLKAAVGRLGKDLTPPGLLPAAAAAARQQQHGKGEQLSSQQQPAAAAAAAAAVDPIFQDAISLALEATGRTFVRRTRTAPNIVNRIPDTAADNDRGFSNPLPRQHTPRIVPTKHSWQQQQQQKGGSSGKKKAATSKQKPKLAGASSSKIHKKFSSSSGGGSSSSKGRKWVPPSAASLPRAKSKTAAAAALVAKARSKALTARSRLSSKSGSAAAAVTGAAAAAGRPKFVPITRPQKGPLVIHDKPHAQPKFSWKHPPVDREWEPPAKGAVLVLGMHFASAAAVHECHAGMAQHRDRARLLQLQQGLGYQPYSFDRDNTEFQAEGGWHIQGNFNSTRGAKDVMARFPGVKFGGIFLDYFRMPTGYALEVYKQQLFSQFVPELVRWGAVAQGVPVVVPNNEVLLTKLAKEGAFQGYTNFIAMPGDRYPLYQATELSTAEGMLQGAYSNESEVRSLCEGSEFVVMHCNMTAPLNGN